MATKRVHEVAKDLGLGNADVLARLREAGVEATSHLSAVEEGEIARAFDGQQAPFPKTVQTAAEVLGPETAGTPSVSAEQAFAEVQAESGERATFYAKGDNYRAVRSTAIERVLPNGSVVVTTPELVYDFSPNGRLTLHAGHHSLPDGSFNERTGEFETQDAITFLRRHPDLNVHFWEEGKEPGRPIPSDDVFIGIITDAAITLNRKPIVALLDQERVTHRRENLIRQADAALAKIEGTREHMGEHAPAEEDVAIPRANLEVTNPEVKARLERQALAASMASPEGGEGFVTPGQGAGAGEIVNA